MSCVESSYHPARRRVLRMLSGLGLTAPIAAALSGTFQPAEAAVRHLDLEDPWDNLEGWLEKTSPQYLAAPTLADKDKQKFCYQHLREHIDSRRAEQPVSPSE